MGSILKVVCLLSVYQLYGVQEDLVELEALVAEHYVQNCSALYPLQKILEAAIVEIKAIRQQVKREY